MIQWAVSQYFLLDFDHFSIDLEQYTIWLLMRTNFREYFFLEQRRFKLLVGRMCCGTMYKVCAPLMNKFANSENWNMTRFAQYIYNIIYSEQVNGLLFTFFFMMIKQHHCSNIKSIGIKCTRETSELCTALRSWHTMTINCNS